MLKVYLSASISNAANNQHLAAQFPANDFLIYLPQTIVPGTLEHRFFPQQVYQQCIDMMTASDMGLVLLDAFGRDCAWECGWYAARTDKALVGFVESSSLFLRDWMVKGGVDALVTTNPRLYEVASQDPILGLKAIHLIPHLVDLPACLQALTNPHESH